MKSGRIIVLPPTHDEHFSIFDMHQFLAIAPELDESPADRVI